MGSNSLNQGTVPWIDDSPEEIKEVKNVLSDASWVNTWVLNAIVFCQMEYEKDVLFIKYATNVENGEVL